MARILAIVVAYNPGIAFLSDNINRYAPYVDKVILWDNSTTEEARSAVMQCVSDRNDVGYITEKENKGISYALNKAASVCVSEGYDFLLTMDQDSKWENFESYLQTISACVEEGVGLYAPNINRWYPSEEDYTSDSQAVTSGLLIPRTTFEKVGMFNGKLFVDGIDVEYCCRVLEAGLKIVRINRAVLIQRFGENKIRVPWGYPAPEYSPSRLYGILSSHLWIMRTYRLEKGFKRHIIHDFIIRTLFDIIFYQDNKREKLRAVWRGINAGLKKDYGA